MAALSARLGERLMRDSGEVAAYIAARWGVVYGHSGCVALLHRLGFEYKRRKACRPGRMRPGRPPSSRDTTNCSTGWPTTRSSTSPMPCTRSTRPAPRMAGSTKATRWRCEGHQGARDIGAPAPQPPRGAQPGEFPQTFHCPLVEAERTDAASTLALLAKLEAGNPGKRRIYVIADNARYHHARMVRQWLERPVLV